MESTSRGRTALAIACSAVLLSSPLTAQDDTPKIPADTKIESHPLGVKFSILNAGTGKTKATPGDDAIVKFHEWVSTGKLINSSKGNGVRIRIGDPQIPFGIALGAQLVGVGGKVKLTVPPARAYGPGGVLPNIPPNATMIYTVELVEFRSVPKPATFIRGDAQKTKTTKSGLKYQVLESGEGKSPAPGDIATVAFTFFTIEGQTMGGTFQYQEGAPMTAPIHMMGHAFLKEALPMMQRGATWRIVAPANLTRPEVNRDTVWHLELVDFAKSPGMPPSDEKASTSTKSTLLYERLAAGKGSRPREGDICVLEFDSWQADGAYITGSRIQKGGITLIVGHEATPHRFLNEIVQLMQIDEVMRVEVPSRESSPRVMPFATVWRLKLTSVRHPLPLPEFQLPGNAELTVTPSGLKYKVLERGDGKGRSPKIGESVNVHYCTWLTDGKAFDSSYALGQPTSLELGRVYEGWNEGLQLMKPGDTFLFVVPSRLGYGPRGTPDGRIPPDATLVLHVKLIAVGSN